MANLCLAALEELKNRLLAPGGLNFHLDAIAARDGAMLTAMDESRVLLEHVPARLGDENFPTVYPAIVLYCRRMDNRQERKFRSFSGPLFVTAEVRVSSERYSGLERELARYIEALTNTLGQQQGQWTDNLAFNGAYEAKFGEVQLGGRNFLQAGEVELELQGQF